MRKCVRCARIYCSIPSGYSMERSRLYRELISFAGNRVWAPGVGCRGVLWVALWRYRVSCLAVRVCLRPES